MAVIYLGGYRLLPGVALGAFMLAIRRVPIQWAALIQPVIDVRILRRSRARYREGNVSERLVQVLADCPDIPMGTS